MVGLPARSGFQSVMYLCMIPFFAIIYSLRNSLDEIQDSDPLHYNDAKLSSYNCRAVIIVLTVKILFDLDFAAISMSKW